MPYRPEKGGLTANNSVYRYNASKSDDGVGGEEGAFSLCTLWCVEAMTRAGEFDKPYLDKALVRMTHNAVQADWEQGPHVHGLFGLW
jgi:GH15 family glucan-1,4-alpha-glucosidase